MVRSVAVAKLTRLAANCICPVVGAGVITATVPPVRHAVHHLTAPHEYALPKTRVRPAAVAPCAPAAGAPFVAALAPAAPSYAAPLPLAGSTPGTDTGIIPTAYTPPTPGVPVDLGYPPVTSTPGTPLVPVPELPDGHSWVQLIVGFGLVGGTARVAQARARAQA